jgi:hypothetical protein
MSAEPPGPPLPPDPSLGSESVPEASHGVTPTPAPSVTVSLQVVVNYMTAAKLDGAVGRGSDLDVVPPSSALTFMATVRMGDDVFSAVTPPNTSVSWTLARIDPGTTSVSAEPAELYSPPGLVLVSDPALLQAYVPRHSLLPRSRYQVQVHVDVNALVSGMDVLHRSASVDIVTSSCPYGGAVMVEPLAGQAGVTR